MNNFQYFKEACKYSELFAYHIFFKDYVFESKRNDFEFLKEVCGEEVLYFEGFWKDQREMLININTFSHLPLYNVTSLALNSTFRLFGTNLFYNLRERLELPESVLDNLVSIIRNEYVAEETKLNYNLAQFKQLWNSSYYIKERKRFQL